MNKVKYIDTYSFRSFHEQFNASLLAMCALVFDQVEYHSGKQSKERVYSLLERGDYDRTKIVWKSKTVVGFKFSRLPNLLRLLFSALNNIFIVLFASRKALLLFNYNNLLSLFTVNWLCRLKKQKVVIFCHGEMEFLIKTQTEGGIFAKLQMWIAKRFFLHPQRESNIYFAVMGDSILCNIKLLVSPQLFKQFVSIDHSYIFDPSAAPVEHHTNKVHLGTVGLLTHAKGYQTLCGIAQSLNNQNVELSVTGCIFADTEPLIKLGVDLPSNNGATQLDYEEFSSRIKRLHYILFLYPTDSYKLIASGAIMDAIDMQKPIVALRNDYFDYLFAKYGDFGYLCDDLSQILSYIDQISSKSIEVKNYDFASMRAKVSPRSLSREFKRVMHDIDFV